MERILDCAVFVAAVAVALVPACATELSAPRRGPDAGSHSGPGARGLLDAKRDVGAPPGTLVALGGAVGLGERRAGGVAEREAARGVYVVAGEAAGLVLGVRGALIA